MLERQLGSCIVYSNKLAELSIRNQNILSPDLPPPVYFMCCSYHGRILTLMEQMIKTCEFPRIEFEEMCHEYN